mgnify:CR=1 FL=1
MEAYAWRSGLIQFGRRRPYGALLIARGPAKLVRAIVEVNATLGYDNKTLLVGNVASAESDDEAYKALCEFKGRVKTQLQRRLQVQPA